MQCIQMSTKQLYNLCTMLDQRRRRWADVVQMLYKCYVFAGMYVHVRYIVARQTRDVDTILCCTYVGPASQTLVQH